MGRAAVPVDVQAVRLVPDDKDLGSQRFKNHLGNGPGSAVGAVQSHPFAPEGVHGQRDQIGDVAMAAGIVVIGGANVIPGGHRDVRTLTVQKSLYLINGLLIHLLTLGVDELDAVVVIGVVAGGDHNAAVKAVHLGDIGHAGGGSDPHEIYIRSGGSDAGSKGEFQHIAGAAGVLADDDAGTLTVHGLPVIIPAQEKTYLVGVICCQCDVGLAPETVCSEILAHVSTLLT